MTLILKTQRNHIEANSKKRFEGMCWAGSCIPPAPPLDFSTVSSPLPITQNPAITVSTQQGRARNGYSSAKWMINFQTHFHNLNMNSDYKGFWQQLFTFFFFFSKETQTVIYPSPCRIQMTGSNCQLQTPCFSTQAPKTLLSGKPWLEFSGDNSTQIADEPAALSSLFINCWLCLDMAFSSALLGPHSKSHICFESLWLANPLPTYV